MRTKGCNRSECPRTETRVSGDGADAPAQDGGFSPLTFAWVLRQLPIAAMATALGRTQDSVRTLERYREDLVEQVLAQAVPE